LAAKEKVFVKDDPTIHTSRQHYSKMLEVQYQEQLTLPLRLTNSGAGMPTYGASTLLRGLAEMDIKKA
jgi:hypothetical protein